MKTIKISLEKFKLFEKIKESGQCNMWLISEVHKIANDISRIGLEKDEIKQIIRTYSQLSTQFKKERDERLNQLNHTNE
jgi:endonuclease III